MKLFQGSEISDAVWKGYNVIAADQFQTFQSSEIADAFWNECKFAAAQAQTFQSSEIFEAVWKASQVFTDTQVKRLQSREIADAVKGISLKLAVKLDITDLRHPLQAGQAVRVGDEGTGCSVPEEVVKLLAHSDEVVKPLAHSGTCIRLDKHICQHVVCQAQNVVALQMENLYILKYHLMLWVEAIYAYQRLLPRNNWTKSRTARTSNLGGHCLICSDDVQKSRHVVAILD